MTTEVTSIALKVDSTEAKTAEKNLLAMGAGRLRTPRELMAMMADAGFAHLEIVPNPMPLQTQILIGRKCQGLPLKTPSSVNIH
jgi:demethylspheroidene O-methyltransferase